MEKTYYTTNDVANICGVYITTVIDWIESGQLKASKTPGGHRRIHKDDLYEFLKKHNYPLPQEKKKIRLLVVDDEKETFEVLNDYLSDEYSVEYAENGTKAIEAIKRNEPDVVLLDLKLPDIDGIELLKNIRHSGVESEVIILTAYLSIKSIIEAMRLGSYDYIEKPFDIEKLKKAIEQAVERKKNIKEIMRLKGLDALFELAVVISESMPLEKMLSIVIKLAMDALQADGGSILIYDEETQTLEVKIAEGSGKEKALGKKIKLGERISGYSAKVGEPIIIKGRVEDDERFKDIKSYEEIFSGISVPIIRNKKLLGVLNLKRITFKKDFTQDDIKLISIFSQDAAILIENGILLKKLINTKL